MKFAGPDATVNVPYAVFAREPNLPRLGNFYPMQFTEVNYVTTIGDTVTVRITPYEEVAQMGGIKNPSIIKYRTVYKPTPTVIDYFYTPYKEVSYPK